MLLYSAQHNRTLTIKGDMCQGGKKYKDSLCNCATLVQCGEDSCDHL
jgi:hypothetical protein